VRLIFTLSCSSEPRSNKSVDEINLVVLVANGTRLDSENQKSRDKEIITYVYRLFQSKARWNGKLEDNLIFKTLNTELYQNNELVNKMSLGFDQYSKQELAKIDSTLKEYNNNLNLNLENLYNQFGNSDLNAKNDLWKFFNEDLLSLTKKNNTNYLVILSSGYFENQRYLNPLELYRTREHLNTEEPIIKPISNKIVSSPWKVIFLELEPNENFDYEYDLLKNSLSSFLKSLDINEVSFMKSSSNINVVKEKLSEFFESNGTILEVSRKRIVYLNGEYIGPILNGKPNGYGKFTTNTNHRYYKEHGNNFIIKGNWQNGSKEGPFELNVDNKTYHGECKFDKGLVTFESDTIYLDIIDG